MTEETLPPSIPFHTRYGFSRPSEDAFGLRIAPYSEICHRGTIRPTILASAIDLVAALFVREIAGTDATFTSDLSLRTTRLETPRSIEVRGRVLREGKRLITTAIDLEADGERFAYGEATFTRIPRPEGDRTNIESLRVPAVIERHPLSRPLEEEVGIEAIGLPPGRVRLSLREAVRNPEGILQGALVALVVECAALSLADAAAAFPSPQIVSEMDLRYLTAARVGPILAQAQWVGTASDRIARVELQDAGRGDRITTSALVRLADAPSR